MGSAELSKTRDTQIITLNTFFVGDKIGDKIIRPQGIKFCCFWKIKYYFAITDYYLTIAMC